MKETVRLGRSCKKKWVTPEMILISTAVEGGGPNAASHEVQTLNHKHIAAPGGAIITVSTAAFNQYIS